MNNIQILSAMVKPDLEKVFGKVTCIYTEDYRTGEIMASDEYYGTAIIPYIANNTKAIKDLL